MKSGFKKTRSKRRKIVLESSAKLQLGHMVPWRRVAAGKEKRLAWGYISQLPRRCSWLLECMWEMREKQKVRICNLNKIEWVLVPFTFLIEKTVGEVLELWVGVEIKTSVWPN